MKLYLILPYADHLLAITESCKDCYSTCTFTHRPYHHFDALSLHQPCLAQPHCNLGQADSVACPTSSSLGLALAGDLAWLWLLIWASGHAASSERCGSLASSAQGSVPISLKCVTMLKRASASSSWLCAFLWHRSTRTRTNFDSTVRHQLGRFLRKNPPQLA